MIGSLLRQLLRRRLLRFLPGGWVTYFLLSPQTRTFARQAWARRQARRGGQPLPPA